MFMTMSHHRAGAWFIMLRDVVNTDEVPAADRLAYFREACLGRMVPSDVYSDPNAGFSARMKSDVLGTIALTRLTGRTPGRRGLRRTSDLIRRSDPRGYSLVLYRQGAGTLAHDERHVEFTPGDMSLIDTSCPYDGGYERGHSESLSLHFARDLLPLPASAADRLRGALLCGRAGVGALLWTSATRVARDIDRYRPADAVRVSTALLDLVAAVLAHELEATDALPAEFPPADAVSPDPDVHRTATRRFCPHAGRRRRGPPHLTPDPASPLRATRLHGGRMDPRPPAGPLPPGPGRPGAERHARPRHRDTMGAVLRRPLQPGLPRRLRTRPPGLPEPGEPAVRC
jgi:hypothetical protein